MGSRKHPKIKAGDVSPNGRWKATGDEFFDKETRRLLVPCENLVEPGVRKLVEPQDFRRVPKTAKRHGKPIKAGDVSPNGRWMATGPQRIENGISVVPCVSLVVPGAEKLVKVSVFRSIPKTSRRQGVNPIAIGEKYGNYRVSGYGEFREGDGHQLFAGACEDCGFESRTLHSGHLRRGRRHECSKLRDRAGFTANGYTVVRKQWHEGALHWLVRHAETGAEEYWSPPRVETELVGDLLALDKECAKAIRDAAFRGLDSPMLREIGATVEAVQFYLPRCRHNKGDELGHILPRKMFHSPRSRVASWHPRLLRWIDKTKNVQMGSLAWVGQFADPVVVASSRVLLAMWTADMQRIYPEGYYGHLHGRGRISARKRALFGLPSRDAEWTAWRREAEAIEAIYDGYGILTNMDGSEVNGG